jgi:hypothetical protein
MNQVRSSVTKGDMATIASTFPVAVVRQRPLVAGHAQSRSGAGICNDERNGASPL